MADGYFSQGLASSLQRGVSDYLRLKENQSLDQYRQGQLEIAKTKSTQERNAAIAKQANDQIDALYKSAEQIVNNMVASGMNPQTDGQKVLSPIMSQAIQTAKLLEANGISPGLSASLTQRFQALVTKPSAEAAAGVSGAAEGTKAASASQAISEKTGIPLERVQQARGLDVASPALDAKINAMVESGVPPEIAKGIASGRYVVSVDPQTGERKVVDVAGQVIAGPQAVPEISPQNIEAFLPKGVDASQITGFKGVFRNTVNRVTDAVGMGLTYPGAEDAANALNDLEVATISLLQAAVPGRPSNYLLQKLATLTVEPASILRGEGSAVRRLKQTRNLISTEIQRMDYELKKPLRPTESQKLRINKGQLEGLVRAYDRVIDGFGKGEGGTEFAKPVSEMSLQDIDKLNLRSLSDEQLDEISARVNELRGGR